MAEGSSKRISVTVKTPKEKQNIESDEDESVEKVKKQIDEIILITLK